MTNPKFIEIDGKRVLWRDLVERRREQLATVLDVEAQPAQRRRDAATQHFGGGIVHLIFDARKQRLVTRGCDQAAAGSQKTIGMVEDTLALRCSVDHAQRAEQAGGIIERLIA